MAREPPDAMDRARKCLAMGDKEQRRTLLESVVQADPDCAEAQRLLGDTLVALGRRSEALVAYQCAAASSPNDVDSHLGLGRVLEDLARYEAAMVVFERATMLAPDHAPAHNDLGNVLQALRRPEAALDAYARAARRAPRSAVVHANVGTMLLALDRASEAVPVLEKARSIDDEFPDPHYHLALAHLALDEPARALEACDRCLSLERWSQEAIALRAILLRELGQPEAALAIFDLDRFLFASRAQTPSGYASLREFNLALAEHVSDHPSLTRDPYGASTRHGYHSGDLLKGDKGPVAALEKVVQQMIARYVSHLPFDARHPFLARRADDCSLRLQANILDPGGYLVSHLHAAGWVSGVYYASVPKGMDSVDDEGGWLEFGRPPSNIATALAPVTRRIRPEEGLFVLFPSYFYHGTLPHHGNDRRLSIGIDLIPHSVS